MTSKFAEVIGTGYYRKALAHQRPVIDCTYLCRFSRAYDDGGLYCTLGEGGTAA
jgi:hypothetical protein